MGSHLCRTDDYDITDTHCFYRFAEIHLQGPLDRSGQGIKEGDGHA
jgi:hypothetical protein